MTSGPYSLDRVKATVSRILDRPRDTTAVGQPCRWPDCPDTSSGWRWSTAHGYVPLCMRHLYFEAAFPE